MSCCLLKAHHYHQHHHKYDINEAIKQWSKKMEKWQSLRRLLSRCSYAFFYSFFPLLSLLPWLPLVQLFFFKILAIFFVWHHLMPTHADTRKKKWRKNGSAGWWPSKNAFKNFFLSVVPTQISDDDGFFKKKVGGRTRDQKAVVVIMR